MSSRPMYHEWPCGQWRQVAAATPGTSNRIRNVAAMIHRHGNVPNTTRADEWYHAPICHPDRCTTSGLAANGGRLPPLHPVRLTKIRNVAAMIHRHSSPGEGLASLDVTDTNVQRFYIFEKHIEKATLALPLGELARHSRD